MLLAGCSFDRMKDGEGKQRGGGALSDRPVTYAEALGAVIGPRCVSCHSQGGGNQGGVSLETYESTSALADRIQRSVFVDKTMPKGSPLSEQEAAILQAWLAQGASRNGARPGSGRLKERVTFSLLRDEVFAPKCLDCHSQPRPEKNLDMGSYAEVKANINRIFDRAVITADMPLPPFERLTVEEKQALGNWIAQGMPE